MGGNEVTTAGSSGSRAPASGYLCATCDTPLIVGAEACVECGAPVVAARPIGTAPPPAPVPTSSPSRRGPLLAAAAAVVVVLGGVVVLTRGGSDSDPVATPPTTEAPAPSAADTPSADASADATPADATPAGGAADVDTAPTAAELCDAVEVYALGDMLTLGDHIVADPDGTLAAYETLVAAAPADLADELEAMGPLTRTAVAAVSTGEVTTTAEIQAWLTNAPRQDLETWVAAQSVAAPVLTGGCGG